MEISYLRTATELCAATRNLASTSSRRARSVVASAAQRLVVAWRGCVDSAAAEREPAGPLERRAVAAMRLPDVVWTHAGGYAPASDLARLATVGTSQKKAVATAVTMTLRRPGGTTRDLYLVERAGSSRLAQSSGGAIFVTRDGELAQFDDDNWELSTFWSRLGNARVLCVSMGVEFGLAVTDQGSVFAWGCNELGQLGHQDIEQDFTEPVRLETLGDVASVAAGVVPFRVET